MRRIIVNGYTPKLKFCNAKSALCHFYHCQYCTSNEISFLDKIYCNNFSDRMLKLKMRLMCEENNDMIVASVVADANFREQKFLYDRYCLDISFVKISMELNVHPNTLQRWRDKFLMKIATMINFNLPIEDIFSRNKVEALIYVLERTINFYESYCYTDKKFFGIFKMKLNEYQNLLFAIRYFLESDSSDIGYKIIRMKILNSNLSVKEFKEYTGISHATINKYVQLFQQKFYPQNEMCYQ